jgi:hypothetical protein
MGFKLSMQFQKQHARILDPSVGNSSFSLKADWKPTFVNIGNESLEYEVELKKEVFQAWVLNQI